jgi:ion channel-forming bestrophin family protein
MSLPSYVGRPLAFLFAIDVAVASAYVFLGWRWLSIPQTPLSIFGGVLGVVAGFRNASAYARWWEARTIWGAIVNNSRTFAREVLSMVHPAEGEACSEAEICETRQELITLQIAYVHALRNALRGSAPWEDLATLIPDAGIARLRLHDNVPLAIQQRIASIIAECHRRGWIDDMRWAMLDRTLTNLMDCQGASERIKNTPMPRLYDVFIHLFIGLYCLLLPLGMVSSLRLLTPVGSTLVCFVFMVLDQLGRDLESPFENQANDIPLSAISRTIEINLRQQMGETDVPAPLAAVAGVLW